MLSFLAMAALIAAPQDNADERPGAFQNIAAEIGLEAAPTGRPQLIDVDGDGWLDLIAGGATSKAGSFRVYFSRPAPDGARRFVDATAELGLGLEPDGKTPRWSSFFLWGDLDADGDLDAVSAVTQTAEEYARDPRTHRVYINDKGRFRPRKDDGLARESHRTTHGAVLCDLDLDGKLDAAFGNSYVVYGKSYEAQRMRAFRGDGKGAFADVTDEWKLNPTTAEGGNSAARPLYGLSAADLDGDGYPELLGAAYGRQWNSAWFRTAKKAVYTDRAPDLRIDGDSIRHGRYPNGVNRRPEQPFRSNGNTFAIAPCDFDGDGDNDLFSASITHAWAGEASDLSVLLVNRLEESGKLYFDHCLEKLAEPDPQTGLRWRPTRGLARDHSPQNPRGWNQGDLQAHWGDIDNDGLIDLLICESDYPHNQLRIFRQLPDHSFVEAQKELGLYWPNGPGLALGDFDRDGDLDLAANGTRNRWKEARPKNELGLLRNDAVPRENGFLCVRLVGDGKRANRSAIGAQVTLVTDRGTQHLELLGPHGHWAAQMQPGELHFGLGKATPEKLVVVWPDRRRSRVEIEGLKRNAWIVIRQGQRRPEVLERFDPEAWTR